MMKNKCPFCDFETYMMPKFDVTDYGCGTKYCWQTREYERSEECIKLEKENKDEI